MEVDMEIQWDASVVEIGVARMILWDMGAAVRRDGDYLLVFRREDGPFYARKVEGEQEIGRLYIDEGAFTGTWGPGSFQTRWNEPWEELVDFATLMRICLGLWDPDWKPEPSPYLGRGRSQGHLIAQCRKRWQELEAKQEKREE